MKIDIQFVDMSTQCGDFESYLLKVPSQRRTLEGHSQKLDITRDHVIDEYEWLISNLWSMDL